MDIFGLKFTIKIKAWVGAFSTAKTDKFTFKTGQSTYGHQDY